jgi:hypothetical protein
MPLVLLLTVAAALSLGGGAQAQDSSDPRFLVPPGKIECSVQRSWAENSPLRDPPQITHAGNGHRAYDVRRNRLIISSGPVPARQGGAALHRAAAMTR